jgi:hypothetical protein
MNNLRIPVKDQLVKRISNRNRRRELPVDLSESLKIGPTVAPDNKKINRDECIIRQLSYQFPG